MLSAQLRTARNAAPMRMLSTSASRPVAVCLTDPRDGNQSNNSGATAAHHMLHMSKGMNNILKSGVQKAAEDKQTPLPFLQTTGGTVFMFDLWKRGVNPFDTLVEHFKATPDVPTSWLNRNVCLNGMEPYSRDVVREYFSLIKDAKREAGNTQPYIMQSFCAQNDLKNLSVTFEEWKELGDDFWLMPFFSFAKTPWDPCESNPERTAAWFREVKAMTGGAEMYGLKQPEGDMTATFAECQASAVRAAIGDEAQLHLHTQGNHGLGLPSLLGAVKGGVNSVDSSFVFGGRGGQEDSFALRYLLQSEGFDVNDWDEDGAIGMWEENIEKHYPSTHRYWRPDPIRANIAGGQRSILQAELDGLRQGDRMSEIFDINMTMRCLGGGGVSVTPLADIYARNSLLWVRSQQLRALKRSEAESLRRCPANGKTVEDFLAHWASGDGSAAEGYAMEDLLGAGGFHSPGGNTMKSLPLTPDFTKMLLGHNGQHPCAPSNALMGAALNHLTDDRAAAHASGAASGASRLGSILSSSSAIGDKATGGKRKAAVVFVMQALSARAVAERRLVQVGDRIAELDKCMGTPPQRALLEQELKMAKQVDESGQRVGTIEERVAMYEREAQALKDSMSDLAIDVSEADYAAFLKTGALDAKHVAAVEASPGIADLLVDIDAQDVAASGGSAGESAIAEVLQLCREAGPKTTPMHELSGVAGDLVASREWVEKLDDEWVLGLSDKQVAQWTLIHSKFQAHPLRLVQRYWRHQLGLEKVFGNLSADDTELDEGHFGMGEYNALAFPEPARLTSMYGKLVKKLRDEIANGSGDKSSARFEALGAEALGPDAHSTADEALVGIEQAFLQKQYWASRAKQLSLSTPEILNSISADKPQIAASFSPFSAAFAPSSRKSQPTDDGDSSTQQATRQDKAQALLNQKLAAIDTHMAQCKAALMPILQSLAVQDPGKYNQSRLRSIDDPSAYRNRIGGFADHSEWKQVEDEAEELWALVKAQVHDEALRKNNRAAERFTPSAALDV